MDNEEFEQTLIRVLNDSRSIDNNIHDKHHQWITAELDRRERKEAMWQKAKLSFIGTLATSIAVFMAWIGKLVLEALQRGNHP